MENFFVNLERLPALGRVILTRVICFMSEFWCGLASKPAGYHISMFAALQLAITKTHSFNKSLLLK